MNPGSLGAMTVYELFRLELDGQAPRLITALLALEGDPQAGDQLKVCMRCVHSLKGAARMIDLSAAVRVAHAMEEMIVAAQHASITLASPHIDALLSGADLLKKIAYTPADQMAQWTDGEAPAARDYIASLQARLAEGAAGAAVAAPVDDTASVAPPPAATAIAMPPEQANLGPTTPVMSVAADERVLRITADNLNQMLGLAAEALVSSRALAPFGASLGQLKRMQTDSARSLEQLDALLAHDNLDEEIVATLADLRARARTSQQFLGQRMEQFESYSARVSDLAQRMYDAALASRMRPFSDGVGAFPRMVRDLAQSLGKQARLRLSGHATLIDRDILDKLEAPLTHLLRNAIDHGIEAPGVRVQAGKQAEAVIDLTAGHNAGMLIVTVSDDGHGIDMVGLRQRVIERKQTDAATAAQLSDAELLEFLFLPGFTLKDDVSDLSGRGVGLDIVQHMAHQSGGSVRVDTSAGAGTRFRLRLPLTMSVVRALVVLVDGQQYAFPLAHINRTLMLAPEQVEQLEGRQHFRYEGNQVGLITAHQVLGVGAARAQGALPVVVIGEAGEQYGVVVDSLAGEHELVVQPLDARLGKVKDIGAAALAEDGSPVLIVDVQDMVRSVDKLVAAGAPVHAHRGDGGGGAGAAVATRKRILVVDDSFTVRELERKLLQNQGYEVEVAVDGMDGWNAARIGRFDLVVTDVDMPRLDGIGLIALLKQHPTLRSMPVMIVSYKDRKEDQQRGLEAGADYYLTKSSFHDESLVNAVVDLIGEATP